MAAIRNFNNNNNDNNNNNNNNPHYNHNNNSNPTNNKGKYYAIIIGVGAVAAIITILIFYQQMQLEAQATEFINNALTSWKVTNGDTGYTAIESIMLTTDFKDKVKEALGKSKTDMDKRSNLADVLTDILPEYMQRHAMLDPSLSNLERGMILAFSNNLMRGWSNN